MKLHELESGQLFTRYGNAVVYRAEYPGLTNNVWACRELVYKNADTGDWKVSTYAKVVYFDIETEVQVVTIKIEVTP